MPISATPRTWVDTETVNAALMNAYIRDYFKELSEPRTTYTPTLTATTTNPTLGTAAIQEGRYLQLNKLVICKIHIQFGTASVAVGSGDYIVSLPVDPLASGSSGNVTMLGSGVFYDVSATTPYTAHVVRSGTSAAKLMRDGTSQFIGAAAPVVPAASDSISLQLIYEAA